MKQTTPKNVVPASATCLVSKPTSEPSENTNSQGEARRLELSRLNADDIQVRARLDQHVVAEYADLLQDSVPLSPIVVYYDGTHYYVADGHHRIAAARKNDFVDIDAVVLRGSRLDAVWHALSANKKHGLRMNRADIRKAIGIGLQLFPDRGNRVIAEQIGCSHMTVADERNRLASTGQIGQLKKTVGADGKARPAKRKRKALIAILSPQRPDIPPVAPASDSSEDSGPVHDTTKTTGVSYSVPDQKMKAVGLAIAAQAIEMLKTIPPGDPERQPGLALVLDWLKTAMTPTCPCGAAEGTVPA